MNLVPSNNLGELLEQLGTLNDRHEQLRALVEALEVRKRNWSRRFGFILFLLSQKKKLNRDEFEAFRNQQNDLLSRLAALERDIDDIRLHRNNVRTKFLFPRETFFVSRTSVISCCFTTSNDDDDVQDFSLVFKFLLSIAFGMRCRGREGEKEENQSRFFFYPHASQISLERSNKQTLNDWNSVDGGSSVDRIVFLQHNTNQIVQRIMLVFTRQSVHLRMTFSPCVRVSTARRKKWMRSIGDKNQKMRIVD